MPVILIVEDDHAVAQIARAGIEHDYTILTAHDVAIAQLLLEEHAGDVVLLDWRLGHQCGAELLDALPKREGLARPLTIVCSGDTSGEEALQHGGARRARQTVHEEGISQRYSKDAIDWQMTRRFKSVRINPSRST